MALKQWEFVSDYRPFTLDGNPADAPQTLAGSFNPVVSTSISAVDQLVNVSPYNHVAITPSNVYNPPTMTRVQPGTASQNEIQKLTLDFSTVQTTTFSLSLFLNGSQSFGGVLTCTPSTPSSTILANLQAMTGVGVGQVAVSGSAGGPYTITFQGTLANTAMNLLQVNFFSGTGVVFGTQGPAGITVSGGSWYTVGSAAVSITLNESVTFVTPSTVAGMTLYFTGLLTSGMMGVGSNVPSGGQTAIPANAIRDGAIASVTVNGLALANVDMYGQTPSLPIYFPGYDGIAQVTSNTVVIKHTGTWNAALNPVGTLTPLAPSSGNSVIGNFTATAVQPMTTPLVAGNYKITVGAGGVPTTYTLQFAPLLTGVYGGTTTFNIGTTYPANQTGGIRGCTFVFTGTGPTAAHAGDTATISTDVVMLGLLGVTYRYTPSFEGNYMAYRSNIVDSGDPNTQWISAEWVQNTPMYQFTLETGQNITGSAAYPTGLVHDATYTKTKLAPTDAASFINLPEMGFVGLMSLPRTRYCQWTLESSYTNYTIQPYFRDVNLFWWNPDTDNTLIGKLGFAQDWAPGPVLGAVSGALYDTFQKTYQDALLYTQGFQINTAFDQYLQGFGKDFSFPTYTGEPVEAYQAKLLGAFQGRQQGGSLQFLVLDILAMVTGSHQVPNYTSLVTTVTANLSTVTAYLNMATVAGPAFLRYTVILTQQGANAYRIDINTANISTLTTAGITYYGFGYLPTLLAQKIMVAYIINYLNPAGSVIIANNLASNINIWFDGVRGTF